ncbi:MAG: DUF5050 domain-containing protein [Eubacteriaceae bacterium]|nr:DUF5050 domain-containing protein [Eubacteriaceae bacterium]
MDNHQETTEELLGRRNNKKQKKNGNKKLPQTKMIVIIVALAFCVVTAGILILFSLRNQNYNKQLDLGKKYLEDGNYAEAKIAYDKAIKIDSKPSEAYQGKAKVCENNGDYQEAKELYVMLYTITGQEQYKEKQDSVGMGNTPGNLANNGMVLTDGDTVYIANKPAIGSITKKTKDRETEILKGTGSINQVKDLNIKGDTLYFRIDYMGLPGYISSSEKTVGLYSIKTDGSDETLIKTSTADLYYGDLMVWGNSLYYIRRVLSNTKPIYLCRSDLNGANENIIVEGVSGYTCDGIQLYATLRDGGLMKIDDSDGQQRISFNNTIIRIMSYNEKLYLTCAAASTQIKGNTPIYVMNTDGSDLHSIAQGPAYGMAFTINDDYLYYSGSDNALQDHIFTTDIRKLRLDGGGEEQVLKVTPSGESLGYEPSTTMNNIDSWVNNICLAGDQIYYEMTSSGPAGGSFQSYFSVNLDGSDNQVISH